LPAIRLGVATTNGGTDNMAEDTKRMENMSKTDQEDIIRKIGGAVNALALRVEAIENTLRSIQGRLEKLEQ
jgi:hypothetical protein